MFNVNCRLCSKFITQKSQEEENPQAIVSITRMLDTHRFEYGISGVFKFKIDLGLHKDDFERDNSVKCSICKEGYQPCCDIEDYPLDKRDGFIASGFGCASEVYVREIAPEKTNAITSELYLSCGWGSRHDLNVYKVKTSFPETYIICDDCIDMLVKSGDLVYERRAEIGGQKLTPEDWEELRKSFSEKTDAT